MERPAVDLVIADYPDGLPVPGVSMPPSSVPSWNEKVSDFLTYVIGFCGLFLHDDGAVLLFYPENPLIKKEIVSFFNNNNLKEKDEWSVINCLHLRHYLDAAKLVIFLKLSHFPFLFYILLNVFLDGFLYVFHTFFPV